MRPCDLDGVDAATLARRCRRGRPLHHGPETGRPCSLRAAGTNSFKEAAGSLASRPSDREAVRNGHRLYGMGFSPKVRTRFPKIRAFLPSAQAARTDEMSRVGATLALSRQMACVQDAGKTHFLRMAKTHTFAVTGAVTGPSM